MQRRFGLGPSTWLALCGGLSVGTPVAAVQQNMADVQIESEYVGRGVYMLTGQGGNIGLSIGDDGPFLVDDQFAPLTDKIRTVIAALSAGEVRFIVNTHWHGDHTGGNENFGEAGALIVAHENVRRRMSTEQFIEAFNSRTPPSPPAALPVITFTDETTLYWNGETIRVSHVSHAHTDGDAIIQFVNANAFHMGDTFFNGMYPFIDVSSGGSIEGIIVAADHVLALARSSTRIIPGHGPLAGVEELRAFRTMLTTVRDRVLTMINDGMNEAQVVAARPTADLDATWGGGFIQPDQFVSLVYQGLVRD